MSLILDALNRSRQDAERVPGLFSNHFVERPASGISPLQWLLVLALTLSVLAIGWLLFDRSPAPGTSADIAPVTAPPAARAQAAEPRPAAAGGPAGERTPAAPASQVPVPAPAPTPTPTHPQPQAQPQAEARPRTQAQALAEAQPQTQAQIQPEAQPPAVNPQATATMQPPEAPAPAPVDPRVAALYEQAAAAPAVAKPRQQQARTSAPVNASREEKPIDIESLVKQARLALADSGLSEHEVPLLSAQSQQTKDAIPTLLYLKHDYSGDPARSSVTINGKTVQVGGSFDGIRVLEILPDSVVLQFKDTRFRLRALNSWVNL